MPTKKEIDSELKEIEAIIVAASDGVHPLGIKAALAARGRRLADRTLRRRLDVLIRDWRIEAFRRNREVYYRKGTAAAVDELSPDEEYPPISPEGERIRALVRRPIIDRQPTGYDFDFLGDYTPGETWYLPEPTRARLHELGRTPDPDRPAGTFARAIIERLLIDLSWASSRLEGNTYSRLDTKNLLEYGQRVEGADAEEAFMILNHKRAIELLIENAESVELNTYTLNNVHATLSEGLLANPEDEGRIREIVVHITGTTYQPQEVPQAVRDTYSTLLETARAITDPFEQAFFVMVHIPYLQPYVDVNKRVSRLAANIPLLRANLVPLSFVDVPVKAYIDGTLGIYEQRRIELLRDVFLWAYERSSERYRVVRDGIQPDTFRLRYRIELRSAVKDLVQRGVTPSRENAREWAVGHAIAEEDLDQFAEKLLELLLALHEDSLGRYGLRPAEFRSWQTKVRA